MQLRMEFSKLIIIKIEHYFQSCEIAWLISEFSSSFKILFYWEQRWNVKVHSYTSSPFLGRWTIQSALHFSPWQNYSFRHQLDFSGKLSAMLQLLRVETIIHSHSSTIVYGQVLIYMAEWTGASWREWKYQNFKTIAKLIRFIGSLGCESHVLPLSNHATQCLTSSKSFRRFAKFKQSKIKLHSGHPTHPPPSKHFLGKIFQKNKFRRPGPTTDFNSDFFTLQTSLAS